MPYERDIGLRTFKVIISKKLHSCQGKIFPRHCDSFSGGRVRSPPSLPSKPTEKACACSGLFFRVPLVYPSFQPKYNAIASRGVGQTGNFQFADFPGRGFWPE